MVFLSVLCHELLLKLFYIMCRVFIMCRVHNFFISWFPANIDLHHNYTLLTDEVSNNAKKTYEKITKNYSEKLVQI